MGETPIISQDIELLLAKSVVEDVAPEEAPFFDDLIVADERLPPREHSLGFGIPDGAIIVATGLLLEVAKANHRVPLGTRANGSRPARPRNVTCG